MAFNKLSVDMVDVKDRRILMRCVSRVTQLLHSH